MKREVVIVEKTSEGLILIKAPDVARFKPLVRNETVVAGGTTLGTAMTHRGLTRWVLPVQSEMGTIQGLIRDKIIPLAFGEVVAQIKPLVVGEQLEQDSSQNVSAELQFLAPTDGIFYHSPSPDQPPFIQVGEVITDGTVIGLIEVMKTFSRVAYGGDLMPSKATVTGFLVQDGAEVHAGQPLLALESNA